jgi:hypothetical protein
MKGFRRISTLLRLLGAGMVAVVTLAIMAHAVQTVVTPNGLYVTYSLAAGASSAAVTPASSTPVLVMGVQNASGYRGVGEVTLLHVPSNFLEWVGLESPSGAAITSGFSGAAGTHIVYLDYSHLVDIQVHNADSFIIHNANSISMDGHVTLVW